MGYDEIQSMSGRYASYWNAFLFSIFWCHQMLTPLLGNVGPNGGVHTALAFLTPKTAAAATVWIRLWRHCSTYRNERF